MVWQLFKEINGRALCRTVGPSLATHWLSDLKIFINFSYFLFGKTDKYHKLDELLLEIEMPCVKYLTWKSILIHGGYCYVYLTVSGVSAVVGAFI